MSEAPEMEKAYHPQQVEDRIYQYWLEIGAFDAEVAPDKQPYCIVIPPPNVTGVLHMGHALDETIQDLLIRWHRMKGFEALWVPGTDHAGIATQNVVEQQLDEEGLTRYDLGREKFVERVWEVKDKHHGVITGQLKRIGVSVDWRRERFTLDEGLSRAVREAFVTLYEQGLIYRGARMINWCPRCGTGLSDLEVERELAQGHLWYIRYPAPDDGPGVVVATTRPETMLGDTAVAVHPQDERYKEMIGQTVILPLMKREIPIVAEDYIDMEFGTGALKVTPAHDPNDLEIGQRHQLPSILVIDRAGKMTEEAGPYAGLDRYECREQVVADLQEQGLLERIEDYQHTPGRCQRCNTVVEPLVSTQWFVKMAPLAQQGLEAVDSGKVRFVPERWTKVYREWLENIEDWCISRQLWWGHPIPVWYCQDCGHETCTREDPTQCALCGSENVQQDPDVLDTWFSSALWPFSTLGWPDKTPELDYFYPTSVLVTGYDIIYFWVARMIMMGLHLVGEEPFGEVFLHGLVRDEHGQKMSKSRGNAVDPIALMDEYGADAMRFALCQLITHGQDVTYSPDRLVGARNFCNKLWNASRFVIMNLADMQPVELESAQLSLADRWILSRHTQMLAEVQRQLDGYNLAQAAEAIYEYVWSEFCDWYVEVAKIDLYGDDDARKATVQTILHELLSQILRTIHPFMPFITEEIWQRLPQSGQTISRQPYPQPQEQWLDEEAEAQMRLLQTVITQIRALRAELKINPGQPADVTVIAPNDEDISLLDNHQEAIAALATVEELNLATAPAEPPQDALSALSEDMQIYLHLPGTLDVEEEIERIRRESDELEKLRKRSVGKLQNSDFLNKAPEQVVNNERKKLAEFDRDLKKLRDQIKLLSTVER